MRSATPFVAALFTGATRLALSLSLLAGAAVTQAQGTYKITIGGSPGGGYDQTGRLLGKALEQTGAKAVSYENKGGAGGTLALAQFARASQGDPQALLVVGAVMVGAIVQDKPPVTLEGLTPVARLLTEYNVIAVPKASPFTSIRDVMDQMKKDPGSVKWGGGSLGSIDHISVAMLARESGLDASQIHYTAFSGGADVLSALEGGKITVATSGLAELEEAIKSGKLRGLAVTAANKLPDSTIPSLSEQGVNVIIGNWRGVYGAAGLNPEQTQALIDAVLQAGKSTTWSEGLKHHRWFRSAPLTGDSFARYVEEDMARKRAMMLKLGML